MNDKKFVKKIDSPLGPMVFVIIAHRTESSENRLIEPDFYRNNCQPGQVPEGVHHELELLEPHLWEDSDISVRPREGHIHIHRLPDTSRYFVCWTGSLPTLENVEALLNVWCLGTAYTVSIGEDFTLLYRGSASEFFETMKGVGFTLRDSSDEAQETT